MASDHESSARFRRSARRLRNLLTGATVLLGAILILERLGYAGAYGPGLDWRELGVQALLSAPGVMNLAALWFLRSAVAAAAQGEPFGAVVVSAFRRVGSLLAASSFTALLIVPFLGQFAGRQVPRLIDADLSALVLAVLGLGMLFVGVLIERAGAAHRELEEFF